MNKSHKSKKFLSIIAVSLAICLVGCSNNKELHEELNGAISELNAAQEKIEELEKKLNEVNEEQNVNTSKKNQENLNEALLDSYKKLDLNELVLGEWYYQDIHEDGSFSWVQLLSLNSDGTGEIFRTYYVPNEEVNEMQKLIEAGVSLPNLDTSVTCTWTSSGDTFKLSIETGEDAEFIFNAEDQQLIFNANNDNEQLYARKMPAGLENYIERSRFTTSEEEIQAKKEMLMRKFVGNWYYDVLVWTFNDDGTGFIDIPDIGEYPATKKEFSYTVYDDPNDVTYLCLVMDWDSSETSYFYPQFNPDGSMTLNTATNQSEIKLTRTFDINNCPISEEIIQTGIDVFTGSIFSNMIEDSLTK